MLRHFKGLQWYIMLTCLGTIPLSIWPQIFSYWCVAVAVSFVLWTGFSALGKDIKWRKKKDKPVAVWVEPVKPDYTKINKWASDEVHKWSGENPGIYAFGRNVRHEKKNNIFELLEDLCYPRIVSWSKEDDRSVGSRMFTYLINIEWPNSEPVELKWHCFEKEFDTTALDTLLTKLEDPKTLRVGMIINNARKSLGLEPDTQYFIIPEDTK